METEQPHGKVNAAANTPDHYWYRQGKDDGVQMERDRIVSWLREQWRCVPRTSRIEVLDFADEIEAGEHWK